MRTVMLSVCAVLVFTPLALAGGANTIGTFELTKGSHTVQLAKAVIVVPDGAPAPVRFAGQELKEHLDLMIGTSFRVVTSIPAHGAAIVLGDCAGARQAGINVKTIARDGYAIRTQGQTIFIAGTDDATAKSEILFKAKTPFGRKASRYAMEKELGAATWDFQRGTLYGVYRFLEELGVRWFLPGEKGRVVPRKKDLAIQAFSLREEPVYILRKTGRITWQWYMLKSARIRRVVNVKEFEDLDWDGRGLRLWFLRMRHSSEWFAFNHRPTRLLLEQRYSKAHPEYFAVRPNGQRDLKPQSGRTGHLCYTHPGVLEITQSDINDYFAGKTGKEMGFTPHLIALNPHNRGWPANAIYGRTVSLLPHDSFRGCECPNCLAVTHKDKPRPAWHSELVWQFVVKAAKWLASAHPDKLIVCLAYASYSEKPEFL
jgi:uncharacterized protein DUF4838/glycosyl hydrolase family 67